MRATLKAVAPEVQSLLTSTPLRKRSKFYTSLIQTFLSRQQPHLCDLHRQQAQGGWSQIYLLGSSPSWSLPTPCSQNWAAPWRILCDPACQRGGHFIQPLSSCISFNQFSCGESFEQPVNHCVILIVFKTMQSDCSWFLTWQPSKAEVPPVPLWCLPLEVDPPEDAGDVKIESSSQEEEMDENANGDWKNPKQ